MKASYILHSFVISLVSAAAPPISELQTLTCAAGQEISVSDNKRTAVCIVAPVSEPICGAGRILNKETGTCECPPVL